MTTAPKTANGKATASLVLGILSFLCCPIIFSVLAIVFGTQAKNEIAANPAMSGEGFAQAGVILGIVSLIITVIGGGLYLAGIFG